MKQLTASDIADWEAFYIVEPFGDLKTEELHGLQCATANNAMGGKADPYDFMPNVEAPPMTRERLMASAREASEASHGDCK